MKRMKRRLLTVLLAIFLAVGAFLPFATPAFATIDTFYSSTSDGYFYLTDTDYNTVWSASSALMVNAGANSIYIGQTYSGSYYACRRTALYFDTSSIPDGATIASATLKLYGGSDASDTDFDIVIQNGQPTYPHDPLVVGDYDKSHYSSDGGSFSTASFATGQYNSIPLNSTGLTWISKTGTTKLMLRSSRDISGTTPSGSEFVWVYASDAGENKPILEVIYDVTAPDITTIDASNVAGTTARLNSTVADDGGDYCEVRWGYGESSESAIEDYDTYTSYSGSYTTGQHPYLDISSLSTSTLYYFRVEIQNSEGTDLGSELSFTTTSGVSDPSDFHAYPSATSVSLSWAKGAGATNSIVRYRNDTYPSSYTDGTLVYQGTSASYTHEGLTRGTTYYYAVWGESGGVYSSGSAQVMVTTSAAETEGDELSAPSTPLRWLTGTDYTNLSNLPIFYDTVNATADTLGIPRATFWLVVAIFTGVLFGAIVFYVSEGSIIPALLALLFSYAFLYAVKQIPLAIPVLVVIILGVMFFTKRREAV